MSDHPKPTHEELLKQVQKLLGPSTGPILPPGVPANTTPTKEHHKEKKAFIGDRLGKLAPMGSAIGEHLAKHDHLYDLAGLGMLAAPSAMEIAHEAKKPKEERHGMGKAVAELGGLGVLAAPVAAQALGFGKHASAFFNELEKLGAVSDAEAMRSLQALQDLEDNKPSVGQTLGYAGIGAAATPLIHAAGNVIRKRSPFEGVTLGDKLRDAGAQVFKGGVGGTAVSIGQQQFDRHHNMGKLRAYVAEHDAPEGK